MTIEEIIQAAQDWDGSGMATPAEEGAFIAGVEWMQEKMIEKAVEWLDNKMWHFADRVEVILNSYNSLEAFLEDFKQAMEE